MPNPEDYVNEDFLLQLTAYLYKSGEEHSEITSDRWEHAIDNYCHANVRRYLEAHRENYPQYKRVRGWLVSDYSGGLNVEFAAHSVVEKDRGQLVDITLIPSDSHAFLKHPGDAKPKSCTNRNWSIVGG